MKDVLQILIAERDRINRAIAVLQDAPATSPEEPAKRPVGRPKGSGKKAAAKTRGRRTFTEEARQAQSEKMKAYWAARRKAKDKAAKGKS